MSQLPQGSYRPINDVNDSALGWEVPVESVPLPSGGLLYPPESFFHNKSVVQIKAMTAREEDILTSQSYIKEGSTIDHLIASCTMSSLNDVRSLLLGDKNALLISIRITGYGPSYDAEVTCPACNVTAETNFNLGDLAIKKLSVDPIEPSQNIFEFLLPVSKKKVKFKLFTGHDSNEVDAEIDQARKIMGRNSVGDVTYRLFKRIISIDGTVDRDQIKKFINIMPAYDSKSLRDYATKIEPRLDTNVLYKCQNCHSESELKLPIGKYFFWPA